MALIRHLAPTPADRFAFRGPVMAAIETGADTNVDAALISRTDTPLNAALRQASLPAEWPIVSEIVRLSSEADETFVAIVSDGKRYAAARCGGRWLSGRICVGEARLTMEEAATDLLRMVEVYRNRTDDLLSSIAKTRTTNGLRDTTCAVLLTFAAVTIYCGAPMAAIAVPALAIVLSGVLNIKEAMTHGRYSHGFERILIGCGLMGILGINSMLVATVGLT
jgi:hypothetical protein